MTYNPGIPNANDLISDSQAQILTNFGQLNTIFGIDHVTLNPSVATSGMHQFVTVSTTSADPVLTFPQSRLYTKSFGTAANRGQEFYFAEKRETNPTLVTLVPTIKVCCQFLTTGVIGAQTLITTNTLTQNVTSVTAALVLGVATFTVNFTNTLDYATYYANLSSPNVNTGFIITNKNVNNLVFQPQTAFVAGTAYEVFLF